MGLEPSTSVRDFFIYKVDVHSLSDKVKHWNGPNKRLVRRQKISAIRNALRSSRLSPQPHLLSFAGSEAHLERLLVASRLLSASDITTIQTPATIGDHSGRLVLERLIQVRDQHLPGMKIWPGSFSAFARKSKLLPSTYPAEQVAFATDPAPRFEIADLDICGVFSQAFLNDFTSLLKRHALAEQSLVFINHQKGRDNPNGQLFAFLRDFFAEEFAGSFIDQSLLTELDGQLNYYISRYVLAPICYMVSAFQAGYELEIKQLLEYRDANPETGGGVYMLQWFMQARQRYSNILLNCPGADLSRLIQQQDREVEELQARVNIVHQEGYKYTILNTARKAF